MIPFFGKSSPSPPHDQEKQESDALPLTISLFLLEPDHQEKATPSDIQENETLGLSLKKSTPGVDLSKFRMEVPSTFLGLRVQDPTPVPLHQNSKRKSPIFDQKRIRRETSRSQVPSHNLSTDFLRIIEPARPVFLYRKCLTPTDVDRYQNRLLVTNTENVSQFLTCDEKHEIVSGENNFIDVIGVDCMGRAFDIRLSTWGERGKKASTSNNSTNYSMETKKKTKKKMSIVFNRQWCDLLEANGIKTDDIAELWGFRRDGKFCLAANFIHMQ